MPRPLLHNAIDSRDPLYHPTELDNGKWLDLKKQPSSFRDKTTSQMRLHNKTVNTTASNWESTLEKCIKSIISIKATRVRCLDTEIPGVFSATGFVVDAKRGIVLSNRHVVSVSPIVAQAVLCNYEEIDLKPIYRDPIHDFGFLQYDPSKVRFLDIVGIELYPEGARVGQEIRVVGNDAGEKLSILSGTLARLDREAPEYGVGEYNDFNTFYLQAASSTSAGSSGSPVLDLQGRAIALNAGGAVRASSSYYLPLHRVQRALRCIQQRDRRVIPRGTLQTEFVYRSYDELLQLGLARHIEQRLRSLHPVGETELDNDGQEHQGLLVVKSLLPDGPASDLLEPGDILLTGNGNLISTFIELEEMLDDHVNQSVRLVISRAGELKECTMPVQDLHAFIPHRYVEFGGGVMHDLSYQMAHSYGLSLNHPGVYVATAGYILGTAYAVRRSVIQSLNNQPVRHLEDFIRILQEIPHGSRVPIRFYSLSKAMKDRVMLLHVDRRWHRFSLAIRNDQTGFWDYEIFNQCPTSAEQQKSLTPANHHIAKSATTGTDPLQKLTKSLVSIDCYPPFIIDGLRSSHSFGAGLVVSLDPPLIVCDRDTVPTALSDISLTFSNSLSIPARLEFLHPFYNFAILSFDVLPLYSAGLDVYAAEFGDSELKRDDKVNYVGLGGDSVPLIKKTYISTVRTIRTKESTPARWRAVNVQALKTGEALTGQGGVLADDEGRVQAYWMNFSTEDDDNDLVNVTGGLATKLWQPLVTKMIESYHNDGNDDGKQERKQRLTPPIVRGLDAEFWTMQLVHARLLGLPEKWLCVFGESDHPHVLYVLGFTNPSSPCASVLKVGDLILSINGDTVSDVTDLSRYDQEESLLMVVFRNGQEINLDVPTTLFDGQETTRVIGWQGLLVQDAYQAAKEQMREKVPDGVYVSCCLFGSPAQVSVKVGVWITEIDQVPVPTLDAFLDVITKRSKMTSPAQSSKSTSSLVSNCTTAPCSQITTQSNHREALYRHHRGRKWERSSSAASTTDLTCTEGKNYNWLLSEPSEKETESNDQATHVRVKYITRDNIPHVSMLRLDLHYWPTWQIRKDNTNPLGWSYESFPSSLA